MDYSLPLALLLKQATKEVHEAAHRSEGASLLVSGKLPKEKYTAYLRMLFHVYSLLESLLLKHADNNVLSGFSHPCITQRSQCLSDDLDRIVGEQAWRTIRSHENDALDLYLKRLTHLDEVDPPLLLAHIYVRILGDLSGGQIIKRRVQKFYHLEDEAVSFFHFGTSQEVISLKNWLRSQMNEACSESDHDLKVKLAAEARMGFAMNVALLDGLVQKTVTLTPDVGRTVGCEINHTVGDKINSNQLYPAA